MTNLVEIQHKIDYERLWELTEKAIKSKLSDAEQREFDALICSQSSKTVRSTRKLMDSELSQCYMSYAN